MLLEVLFFFSFHFCITEGYPSRLLPVHHFHSSIACHEGRCLKQVKSKNTLFLSGLCNLPCWSPPQLLTTQLRNYKSIRQTRTPIMRTSMLRWSICADLPPLWTSYDFITLTQRCDASHKFSMPSSIYWFQRDETRFYYSSIDSNLSSVRTEDDCMNCSNTTSLLLSVLIKLHVFDTMLVCAKQLKYQLGSCCRSSIVCVWGCLLSISQRFVKISLFISLFRYFTGISQAFLSALACCSETPVVLRTLARSPSDWSWRRNTRLSCT